MRLASPRAGHASSLPRPFPEAFRRQTAVPRWRQRLRGTALPDDLHRLTALTKGLYRAFRWYAAIV